jgi:hypothetical protein
MFTGGLDTTNVIASAWSGTSAMIKSIWEIRTEMLEGSGEGSSDITSPVEQLPALSLLVPPQPRTSILTDLVEERREMAA